METGWPITRPCLSTSGGVVVETTDSLSKRIRRNIIRSAWIIGVTRPFNRVLTIRLSCVVLTTTITGPGNAVTRVYRKSTILRSTALKSFRTIRDSAIGTSSSPNAIPICSSFHEKLRKDCETTKLWNEEWCFSCRLLLLGCRDRKKMSSKLRI